MSKTGQLAFLGKYKRCEESQIKNGWPAYQCEILTGLNEPTTDTWMNVKWSFFELDEL